jgi:hypothetical protein
MTLIRICLSRIHADDRASEIAKTAGLLPIKPKSILLGTPDATIAEMRPDLVRLSALISAHLRQIFLCASAPPW